jgi:hypothetical protein
MTETETKQKRLEWLRKYYSEKYFETGDEFYLGMMAASRQLEQESLA